MTESIRRNATKILAISLLLMTGAASAQPSAPVMQEDKQLQSDRPTVKADQGKLHNKREKTVIAKDKTKVKSDAKK